MQFLFFSRTKRVVHRVKAKQRERTNEGGRQNKWQIRLFTFFPKGLVDSSTERGGALMRSLEGKRRPAVLVHWGTWQSPCGHKSILIRAQAGVGRRGEYSQPDIATCYWKLAPSGRCLFRCVWLWVDVCEQQWFFKGAREVKRFSSKPICLFEITAYTM